jgi:hypothetical protein
MTRALVTSLCLILALLVIWVAYALGPTSGPGQLLVNVGADLLGTVITVAVIEWFLDRARLRDQARDLAWNTLYAVEHAVWVWQGGPREIETDELLAIVHAVGEQDPVPDFTENLFFNVGTRSKRALHRDLKAVQTLPGLMDALEHFSRLNTIREGRTPMSPAKIAGILEEGIRALAKALGLPQERLLARLIRYRDPAADQQAVRQFGMGFNAPARGERVRESALDG